MNRTQLPESGPSPSGLGIWHRPRELASTKRYETFVKRLRKEELINESNNAKIGGDLKIENETRIMERSEGKASMAAAKTKAEALMKAHDDEENIKRKRLLNLLENEEKRDIQEIIAQAQSYGTLIRKKRMETYANLKQKQQISQKIHKPENILVEDLFKLHLCDSKAIQQYQILEKKMLKNKEKEFDQCWYEELQRYTAYQKGLEDEKLLRKTQAQNECNEHNMIIQQAKKEKQRQIEELKKENALEDQKLAQEALEEEAKEQAVFKAKRAEQARLLIEHLHETRELQAKEKQKMVDVNDNFYHLQTTQFDKDEADAKLKLRKDKDFKDMNDKLIQLKKCTTVLDPRENVLLEAVVKRDEKIVDDRRCRYIKWAKELERAAIEDTIMRRAENIAKLEEAERKMEMERNLMLLEQERSKLCEELHGRNHQRFCDNTKCELLGQVKLVEQREKERQKETESSKILSVAEIMQQSSAAIYQNKPLHAFTRVLQNEIHKCDCEK